MNPEHGVTSLELSKQLKDAGFPQDESYWSWDAYRDPICIVRSMEADAPIAAPSVAELGEWLPCSFATRRITGYFDHNFKVYNSPGRGYHHEFAPTEAEARGLMALWLLEDGYK